MISVLHSSCFLAKKNSNRDSINYKLRNAQESEIILIIGGVINFLPLMLGPVLLSTSKYLEISKSANYLLSGSGALLTLALFAIDCCKKHTNEIPNNSLMPIVPQEDTCVSNLDPQGDRKESTDHSLNNEGSVNKENVSQDRSSENEVATSVSVNTNNGSIVDYEKLAHSSLDQQYEMSVPEKPDTHHLLEFQIIDRMFLQNFFEDLVYEIIWHERTNNIQDKKFVYVNDLMQEIDEVVKQKSEEHRLANTSYLKKMTTNRRVLRDQLSFLLFLQRKFRFYCGYDEDGIPIMRNEMAILFDKIIKDGAFNAEAANQQNLSQFIEKLSQEMSGIDSQKKLSASNFGYGRLLNNYAFKLKAVHSDATLLLDSWQNNPYAYASKPEFLQLQLYHTQIKRSFDLAEKEYLK